MAYKVPTEKKARIALLVACDTDPDRWRDQDLIRVCAALMALRDRSKVGRSAPRLVTFVGGHNGDEITGVRCTAEDLARQVAALIDDHDEDPDAIRVWMPAAIKLTHETKVTYELTGTDLFKETD